MLPHKLHEMVTVIFSCSNLRINFRTISNTQTCTKCLWMAKATEFSESTSSQSLSQICSWRINGQRWSSLVYTGCQEFFLLPGVFITYVLQDIISSFPHFPQRFHYIHSGVFFLIYCVNNLPLAKGHWTTRNYIWISGRGIHKRYLYKPWNPFRLRWMNVYVGVGTCESISVADGHAQTLSGQRGGL